MVSLVHKIKLFKISFFSEWNLNKTSIIDLQWKKEEKRDNCWMMKMLQEWGQRYQQRLLNNPLILGDVFHN
ncbi:hypothetical protein [Klebsiella pneumoniae]|uniref:hypothetical protein n=1 Tax=Klebsiella pneumoniae TaxID=573 RepID=UPI0019143E43|nr:hypothetical protein [Klebsiella pneumoniae]MDO8851294.1 hypothetical protein [Klebsiella pneumoniae]MDO8854763.1 hypothetical protein [Klebsiella pneumoniae]MDO8922453.1 hypothetical protein [Klebsiella pneumoniae]WGF98316.1 hypothetical protein QCB43_09855 [Klebsiella pneumoniae]HCP5239842.1 hypothetical protein [Klebsiella pneumoniae]